MTDIRTVQSFDIVSGLTGDWLLTDAGVLDDGEPLATAFRVALLTDRTANTDDVLPDWTENRRGWWADYEAAEIWDGWPIGSRLWLLSRAKITDETVPLAEDYCREALRPFVDRRIVSRVDIALERLGIEMIGGTIHAFRGPKLAVDLRFESLWAEIRSR